MAYATVTDVATRLGRELTDAEERQVVAWLEDLEVTILGRVPNLYALVDDGSLHERVVVMIEAAAIIRVLRNPDGKLTERIDDYSWTRASSTAEGTLGLLDSEWEQLTVDSSTGAFSIRPYYEPGWCDTTGFLGWERTL